ncbi:MAG: MarR family transcriptional regulator [Pseudomonadota bacterium]
MERPTNLQVDVVKLLEEFGPLYRQYVGSLLPDGMGQTRLQILAALSEHGAMSMSQLRARVGGSAQNLTGLIDALERDQQVVRNPHPHDRRVKLIALTESALGEVLNQRDEHRRDVAKIFEHLTPRQIETFRYTLTQLIKSIKAG